MVTETGLFPGAATSGTEEDDALVQAAGMASYVYWETASQYNIPFNWVQRHAAEVRKDQIVTRPNSFSDRLTPYGNMMKMFGMMKATKVAATTNTMDANGLGVYGIGTKDANGLSVLVWNYQHTATQDYYTNLAISNLSSVFSGGGIRKKVYRIDQRTSNNYYNAGDCNLQLVDDTVISRRFGKSFAGCNDREQFAVNYSGTSFCSGSQYVWSWPEPPGKQLCIELVNNQRNKQCLL
jgi:hypothetical protein